MKNAGSDMPDVFRYSMSELVKRQYKVFKDGGYVSTFAGRPVILSDKSEEEGECIMTNNTWSLSPTSYGVYYRVDNDDHTENVERPKPFPEKIIVSGKVTTVIWKDGQKTTVRCMEGNTFSEYDALVQAYFKREMGTSKVREKYMKSALKRVIYQTPKKEKPKKKVK